jgi:diguanylate cyclase (GGDEF)-like protein
MDGRPLAALARQNAWWRLLGFAVVFFLALAAPGAAFSGLGVLVVGIAQCLLWPLFALWRVHRRTDPMGAERQHLQIDAIIIGTWLAYLGFPPWLMLAALVVLSLSSLSFGGPRHLPLTLAALAGAAVFFGMVFGFRFEPAQYPWAQAGVAALTLIHVMGVANGLNRLSSALHRAHRDAEERNRTFRMLLDFGRDCAQADDLDSVLLHMCSHFERLYPGQPYAVVMLAGNDGASVQWARFGHIPQGPTTDALLLTVRDPAIRSNTATTVQAFGRPFVALRRRLKQSQGVLLLLVESVALEVAESQTLDIFLDQAEQEIRRVRRSEVLRHQAQVDPLTGLANRAAWEVALIEAQRACEGPRPQPFAVVMADLNGLKALNDRFGHDTGDRAIVATGELLRSAARATDIVARLGGDEFIVLCRDCGRNSANVIVDRIQRLVGQGALQVERSDGEGQITLSVSLGWVSSEEVDASAVMREADHRMYRNKHAYYASHGK